MSIDRSLRSSSSLVRHRNVLTRAERVERLMAEERFGNEMSPLGLPQGGPPQGQVRQEEGRQG